MSGEYIPPFRVRFLRGTDGANNQYRGPVGEITIDLTNWRIRIHDGQTFGGHAIASLKDLEQLVTRLDGLSLTDIAGAEDLRTEAQISTLITNAVGALETQLRGEISAASGGSDQDFEVRELTVNSHILPANNTIDIGSETQRFRGIYVDEAYLSTNTLYIGDTPILGTEQDTVMIKADPDQSITVRTQGTGITTMQSDNGASIRTTGTNADVNVIASGTGSKVRFTADDDIELIGGRVRTTGDLVAVDNVQVGKNLTVTGDLTVNGERVVIDTEHVRASDNMIQINYGETGSGVTAGIAGIEVDRGDMTSYQFVFDETAGLFRIGMVSDLETVATRPWVESGFAAIDHGHEAASSTVSGFMSAEDKAKLNGIETGATADQTKADIDALNINAATVNGNTVASDVPAGAVFTDTVYDDSGLSQQVSTLETNKADKTAISNVDNTADVDKPVSTAQQSALDLKIDLTAIANVLDDNNPEHVLSAAQGKALKDYIDNINAIINSDDSDLDELQEIVDFIKVNREDLQNLGINNISGLEDALGNKVGKVTGKGLSTNDYTDGEKTKLAGVETGAQVNVSTNLSIGGSGNSRTVVSSTGSDASLPTASTTSAGLMSTGDKSKLNGVESGAQVNTVTTVAGKTGAVTLGKVDVGLDKVDNTSDAAKPISNATRNALDLKLAYADVVNTLTSSAADAPLSANQGRVLKGHIDNINTLLDSDTGALDTLQEIVDYIQVNRESLNSLNINAIAGLQSALNSKVDKVTGKGLSANDYTDGEKSKLSGIAAGAQVNVATNLGNNATTSSVTITSSTGDNTTVGSATNTVAGIMGAGDKSKLDGIETGAQRNVATNLSANRNSTTYTVASSTGTNVTLQAASNADAGVMTSADKNKLDSLEGGAEVNTVVSVAGKTGAVALNKNDVGLNNVNNTSDSAKPVSTAQQTALDLKLAIADVVDNLASTANNRPLSANQGRILKGHIDNVNTLLNSDTPALDTLQEIVDYVKINRSELENLDIGAIAGLQAALNNKVDKVAGKVLSSNDYTNAEKSKLGGIQAGAQVNVGTNLAMGGSGNSRSITSSTGNNVSVPVVTTSSAGLMSTGDKNKLNGIAAGAQVNTVTTVAGRTGAVTLTHSDIGGLSDAATTSVAAIRSGTSKANVGLNNVDNTSDAAKPVSSAQQTALNGKVDKVSGKQLSDQNFTSGEKNKLSGIEAGAQKNVALETLLAPLGFSNSGGQWILDAGTL